MAYKRLFDAVVIGVSAGGLAALDVVLPGIDPAIPVPILIVQHISPESQSYLPKHYDTLCRIRSKEADDKEMPKRATVYFAPPNYHLLVEPDGMLSLSAEDRVNFSRPSIDVLFETAAEAFGHRLVGVILTGANNDGALGLKRIQQFGGVTVVQNPDTAEMPAMPEAALEAVRADHILPLEEIAPLLNTLLLGSEE